eukprot:scaffold6130_cov112-Isochrysis_galbana.AAC.3
MGDPSRYPEIRTARHMYALQWLPREIRDDRPLLQQWIDNNMTYQRPGDALHTRTQEHKPRRQSIYFWYVSAPAPDAPAGPGISAEIRGSPRRPRSLAWPACSSLHCA